VTAAEAIVEDVADEVAEEVEEAGTVGEESVEEEPSLSTL
jgi:hypothetical protein